MQIDDLADTIQRILDGYQEDLVKGINEAGQEAAEECKKILRQNSPKRFGRYARSWSVKETPGRPGEPMRYTVYNKKYYSLTHLLEKGHAKRSGGRVPAQVHIAPAEEVTKKKFVQDVEAAVRGN
mgnify:FL=1